MIVIQEIIIWWTKLSRSTPNATLRNAVPLMLALPALTQVNGETLAVHHRVWYNEEDRFQTPHQQLEIQPADPLNPHKWLRFNCVSVHTVGASVEAMFAYTAQCGGAPERSTYPRKVLTLDPGQWGQIQYNGRFSSASSDWYYRTVIANVANLDSMQEEISLTEPVRVFRELADLW